MGQTFFKFLYLNTFHSRLLQLPSLVMWHHHYGWHLTPTPFWQAHGCCPSCSGVTCGQEESQAAWASMGAMPCCWPSCKQLCMIWQTLALESSPIDSCLLLTMPRQGRGVRIWPSGQSPPSWPGRYLPPRWTLRCDLSCFQKATLSKRRMQGNRWAVTFRQKPAPLRWGIAPVPLATPGSNHQWWEVKAMTHGAQCAPRLRAVTP